MSRSRRKSRQLNRADTARQLKRSRKGEEGRPWPPSRAGSVGTLQGVPVYDGLVIQSVDASVGPIVDARVVLGIGPEGEAPVAYVAVCPCDGVRDIVQELTYVGALAAEHHPPHVL